MAIFLSLNYKIAFYAAKGVTSKARIAASPTAIAALLLSASTCLAVDSSLKLSLAKYRSKYPLQNPNEILIDDSGVVPKTVTGVVDKATLASDLKGVKNFRYVLNGILYRGGKISPADKERIPPKSKPDNHHPMSRDGLQKLCQQGFSEAIYLYQDDKRVETPDKVTCTPPGSEKEKTLVYKNLPPLISNPKTADKAVENTKAILADIRQALLDDEHKPVYVHCWNGLHASGFISAVALRQFCNFSKDAAIAYWDINTGGVCVGKGLGKLGDHVGNYDAVRRQIESFVPSDDLAISDDIRKAACPTITYQRDNTPNKHPWLDQTPNGPIFKVNEHLYCSRS